MEDESHHAVADVGGLVRPDPSGSSDGFEPSPKLRARIEKLAHWRIDPSSIEIEEGSEYHGGHATVSTGLMRIRGMDMRDIEERALGKKLVGKAKDDFLERQKSKRGGYVAVKKVRLADDTDLERVLGLTIREAKFLAELDHPNIVELEGFVEDVSEGIIWLVFPWSWDGNLKEFVAKAKWEIPERISLISDVAKGLEYLHTRSPPICHGDLKSLNILIYYNWDLASNSTRNYARITDFGSARRLPQRDPNMRIEQIGTQLPSAQPPSAAFSASTKTITLTGNKYTLRWAAPELLREDQLSLWSDIWALGWIAYEVMTGSLPFEDAASEIAVVERVLEGKLPSLRDSADLMVIHELCSLMNECWEVQPTQRPTADSCRRSIEKMPMFAPEMEEDERVVSIDRLHQLRQIYQSRGEHGRVFTLFAEALGTGWLTLGDQIEVLRNLTELARFREEYSETIAVYDVIWKLYEGNDKQDTDGLADAFWDLAELHRLQEESERTGELRYEGQKIQELQRVTKALCAMAETHRRKGSHDRAIQLNSNALKISQDLSDREGRADALWGLAEAHRLRSEHEEAIPLYSEVLEIRSDFGDRKGRADALWGLAEAHRLRSEYEEAIPLYSEVLGIRTNLGDRKGRADALWGLADVHRRRREWEEATSLYSGVVTIRTALGSPEGRANALWGLADVHRCRGEYEEAIALHSEVLEIYTGLDDKEGRVDALWGLADACRCRSEYEKAIQLYSEILNLRSDLEDEKGRVDALWGLADVHQRRREYEKAIPLFSEVLRIRTNLGDRKGRADALWGLADVHRRRKEYEAAIPFYYNALRICTDINDREGKASALLGLADIYYDQVNDGDNLYQQVAEILEPSRTFADPTLDDERLIKLRIRVLNVLVRRLGSLASDLTKGLPTETAPEAWVSV